MSSKSLLTDSQKRVALEKGLKANVLDPKQRLLVEYLKLRFETALTRWISGVETADPERLRGEMACLKDLIQILSNSKLELFEGDV